MQRSTTVKCLLRSAARRTDARWMSSAPGQSGPQADAPPTPAPRRTGARLGTWAEIDTRFSIKPSPASPFTPSLDWVPQTSKPASFAQRQAAARRQQLAQQAAAEPKHAPASQPTEEASGQPSLDLSNIINLSSRNKNTRKDNPRKARQQQLEAASASVDPSQVHPPRELLVRRSNQNQQPRQPKQKKQRSRDNRKPTRTAAPTNESHQASVVDVNKFDMLPETQADGAVRRLQLETNLDALFAPSGPPARPLAASEPAPAAKAAPAPPAAPALRITQTHGLPYMGKRRLMEQFGGRYSRFLPDKVVAASLATKKRDPLALARLSLARSRDVGLGRRKATLELINAAAANPAGAANVRV